MRIYAICLVRDEEDIVEYSLNKASKWADKIFVLDNGSTDNTWNIVNSLSDEKIIPVGIINKKYKESHRAIVYNLYKDLAKKGDWWCIKLDIDEIYYDNPRDFLRMVPDKNHVVYSDSFEYYLTKEDLEDYTYKGNFHDDVEQIKYYFPTTWSELVFFRHVEAIKWSLDLDSPKFLGVPHDKKIRLKHYKYRSPNQIEKRLQIRSEIPGIWPHEKLNYIKEMYSRKDLLFDNGTLESKGCRNKHYHWPIVKKIVFRILYKITIFS